ncbi:MAG: thiamine phosphate synthase [Sphingomonadales bacterium]|nr:thiamine phosphate synthase [Sphingomonadales bacterium]
MARCYSAAEMKRHPRIPAIWLVSDARNDACVEAALRKLPRGSGFIFRHHHLPEPQRRTRWQALRRLAHANGHLAILAAGPAQARHWRADGAYGPPARLAPGPALLRLVTTHGLHELLAARRARADAVLLSPVYPTRTHPGAPSLGPIRFRALACHAGIPVIALGGMTAHRARALRIAHWAAIDGLS